jgi:hypothetical protein
MRPVISMQKILSSLSVLVLAFALASPAAIAQCAAYGTACPSGMLGICSSQPVVGTPWVLGQRDGSACGLSSTAPGPMFTLFGSCFAPGLPISSPPACTQCSGCSLHAFPVWATLQWTWPPRTTTIQIPSDPNLIGATLCIQDVCFNASAACICMAGALQVTFL